MKQYLPNDDYFQLLCLQQRLNSELQHCFEVNQHQSREFLADLLIRKVEELIDGLNDEGHNFYRCDYSGDINYQNSTQCYSDGGLACDSRVLNFHGFSVQAIWDGPDQ